MGRKLTEDELEPEKLLRILRLYGEELAEHNGGLHILRDSKVELEIVGNEILGQHEKIGDDPKAMMRLIVLLLSSRSLLTRI